MVLHFEVNQAIRSTFTRVEKYFI